MWTNSTKVCGKNSKSQERSVESNEERKDFHGCNRSSRGAGCIGIIRIQADPQNECGVKGKWLYYNRR